MKKNLLRKWRFLLLSFVILILFSCRTDLYENLTHHDAQRNVSRISFSQFKKEMPRKSISQDIMVDMIREANGHSSHKGEEQLSMATFRMDTARVQRLEMDGMTAYSMAAYNYMDPTSQLYNVVYFSKDGEVHYTIHEIHANKTSSTVYDSRFPSKVFVSNPEIAASVCLEPYQSLEWACKNSEPDNKCDKCSKCFKVVTYYTSAECGSSGGPAGGYDDGGDPDLPGPGTGTGTGTSGGPPSDPSHYFFDPLGDPSDPFQIRSTWAKMFWHHLENDDKEWTNEHPNKYMAILEHYLDHLDKYGYMGNEQNEAHHKWLIQILRNNPSYEWQFFYNQFLANPCEKTQTLMANTDVKNVVKDLKNHITTGTGGEKGWKFNKTGSPSETTHNSDHSVNFGMPNLINGGYHNHTGYKVDIFSATDISTLIEITRFNGPTNPTDAFMGLVAPNGVHYVIRFNGTQADIPALGAFTPKQLKDWEIEQAILMSSLSRKPEFIDTVNGVKMLNSKGLERIIFDTFKKMGLNNKITIHKMDNKNNVSTVNENSDGSTTSVPCS